MWLKRSRGRKRSRLFFETNERNLSHKLNKRILLQKKTQTENPQVRKHVTAKHVTIITATHFYITKHETKDRHGTKKRGDTPEWMNVRDPGIILHSIFYFTAELTKKLWWIEVALVVTLTVATTQSDQKAIQSHQTTFRGDLGVNSVNASLSWATHEGPPPQLTSSDTQQFHYESNINFLLPLFCL